MVERKSKKTQSASMYVQRVTGLIIMAVFVATAYVSLWMDEESQVFANNFYYQ
jgi:succinate dehydrogenase/fumarate reductase cytochrome b subunit